MEDLTRPLPEEKRCSTCPHVAHTQPCVMKVISEACLPTACACNDLLVDEEARIAQDFQGELADAAEDYEVQAKYIGSLLEFYNRTGDISNSHGDDEDDSASTSASATAPCCFELHERDLVYVISAEWWNKWKLFVGLDSSSSDQSIREHPGTIKNADIAFDGLAEASIMADADELTTPESRAECLAQRSAAVKAHPELRHVLRPPAEVALHRDFEVVPSRIWQCLRSWYGCDIELPRPVVKWRRPKEVASNQSTKQSTDSTRRTVLTVELYPQALFVWNEGRTILPPQLLHFVISPKMSLETICKYIQAHKLVERPPYPPYSCLVLSDTALTGLKRNGKWRQRTAEEVGMKPFCLVTSKAPALPKFTVPKVGSASTVGGSGAPSRKRGAPDDNSDGNGGGGGSKQEARVFGPAMRPPRDCDVPGIPDFRGCVGLKNLGNTCFMNSSLQVLNQCPGLANFFLSHEKYTKAFSIFKDSKEASRDAIPSLSEPFVELTKKMWGGAHKTLAPSDFKIAVGANHPQFSGFEQHDALEFITKLIATLGEETPAHAPPALSKSPISELDNLEVGLKSADESGKHSFPDTTADGAESEPLDETATRSEAKTAALRAREAIARALASAKDAQEHWEIQRQHIDRGSEVAALFTSATVTTRTCKTCSFPKTSFDCQAHISIDLPHDPTRIFRLVPLLGVPGDLADLRSHTVDSLTQLVFHGKLMRFGCRLNYYTATVADLQKSFFDYRDAEASVSGKAVTQARTIADPGEDSATQLREKSFVICETSQAYGGGIRVSFLDGSTRLRALRSSGIPPLLLRCYTLPEREANIVDEVPSDSDDTTPVDAGAASKPVSTAIHEVDDGTIVDVKPGQAGTAALDQPSTNTDSNEAKFCGAWQCTACTFAGNAAGTSACSVCGTLNADGKKAVSDAAAAALQGFLSSTAETNSHEPAEDDACRILSTSNGDAETKYMDDECIVCYCEVPVKDAFHYACGLHWVCRDCALRSLEADVKAERVPRCPMRDDCGHTELSDKELQSIYRDSPTEYATSMAAIASIKAKVAAAPPAQGGTASVSKWQDGEIVLAPISLRFIGLKTKQDEAEATKAKKSEEEKAAQAQQESKTVTGTDAQEKLSAGNAKSKKSSDVEMSEQLSETEASAVAEATGTPKDAAVGSGKTKGESSQGVESKSALPIQQSSNPEMKDSADSWTCEACTFCNLSFRHECEMCRTSNPAVARARDVVTPPKKRTAVDSVTHRPIQAFKTPPSSSQFKGVKTRANISREGKSKSTFKPFGGGGGKKRKSGGHKRKALYSGGNVGGSLLDQIRGAGTKALRKTAGPPPPPPLPTAGELAGERRWAAQQKGGASLPVGVVAIQRGRSTQGDVHSAIFDQFIPHIQRSLCQGVPSLGDASIAFSDCDLLSYVKSVHVFKKPAESPPNMLHAPGPVVVNEIITGNSATKGSGPDIKHSRRSGEVIWEFGKEIEFKDAVLVAVGGDVRIEVVIDLSTHPDSDRHCSGAGEERLTEEKAGTPQLQANTSAAMSTADSISIAQAKASNGINNGDGSPDNGSKPVQSEIEQLAVEVQLNQNLAATHLTFAPSATLDSLQAEQDKRPMIDMEQCLSESIGPTARVELTGENQWKGCPKCCVAKAAPNTADSAVLASSSSPIVQDDGCNDQDNAVNGENKEPSSPRLTVPGVDAEQVISLSRAAPYLVMQLSRFRIFASPDGKGRVEVEKIQSSVNIPAVLDIAPYFHETQRADASEINSFSGEPLLYDRIGVVYHSGSAFGGHYTAIAYNPATKSWHNFNDSITAPIGESAVRPPGIADFLPEAVKSETKTGSKISTAGENQPRVDSVCPDENSSKPEAEPATNLESKAETIAAGGKEAIDFEAARAQTAFEASIDVPPPVVVDPQLAYIVVYQRRGMIPSLSLPPVDKVEVTAARPPTPVWVPGPSTGVPPPPPGPPPGGGQAPSAGRPPTPCAKLSKVSHIPPLELSGTASQPASEGFRPIDEPSKITRSAKTKASGHQVSFREDLPEQSEYGRGGGGKRKKYCHDATSVMGRVDEVPTLKPLLSATPDFIQQFCAITNASDTEASQFWDLSNGDLEQAINMFFRM